MHFYTTESLYFAIILPDTKKFEFDSVDEMILNHKNHFFLELAHCVKGVKRDHRDVFHLGFGQSSFFRGSMEKDFLR